MEKNITSSRALGILLFVLPGIAVGVLVGFFYWESQKKLFSLKFQNQVADIKSQLVNVHREKNLALQSVQAFFDSSSYVDREEFQTYTTPILNYIPHILALEWVPLVHESEKSKFFREAKSKGFKNFRIYEMENGELVPASKRSKYYPAWYINPMKGNEKAFGYDLYSNPIRRNAIEQAFKSNSIRNSKVVTLVQSGKNRQGSISLIPVTKNKDQQGLILAVVDLDEFIRKSFTSLVRPGMFFTVIPDGGKEIHLSNAASEEIVIRDGFSYDYNGRSWMFLFKGTSEFQGYPDVKLAIFYSSLAFLLVVGFMYILFLLRRNSTSREAIKNALRMSRDKSRFLANMSHEIRTPLTTIIGLLDVMNENKDLSPSVKENLSVLQKSSNHLYELINNILDFSSIESSNLALKKSSFKLKEFLDQTVEMLKFQAESKGLKFRSDSSITEDICIESDPTRIRQVLMNVLGNAIKFTDEGSVTLTSRLSQVDGEKALLVFEVKDTGIGFSDQFKESIFNAYSQDDASRSRKHDGTGLGMSITKRIVDGLDGEIKVFSKKGLGTKVLIHFPVRLVDIKSISGSSEKYGDVRKLPTEGDLALGEVLNILVVDDSADNRKLIKLFLKDTPHMIEEVENGLSAVRKASEGYYDLIFMDIQMPEMDGLEATKNIRIYEKNAKRPASFIVSFTADVTDGSKREAAGLGFDHFIAKPLRRAELLKLVGEISELRYNEKKYSLAS